MEVTLPNGQVIEVEIEEMELEDGRVFQLPVLPTEVATPENFQFALEQTLGISLEDLELQLGMSIGELHRLSVYADVSKTIEGQYGLTSEDIASSPEWGAYAMDLVGQITAPLQRPVTTQKGVPEVPPDRAFAEKEGTDKAILSWMPLFERARGLEEATGKSAIEQYWEEVGEVRGLAERGIADPLQYPQHMRTNLGAWEGMPPPGQREVPVSPEGVREPPLESWYETTGQGKGYRLPGFERWLRSKSRDLEKSGKCPYSREQELALREKRRKKKNEAATAQAEQWQRLKAEARRRSATIEPRVSI